VTGNYGYISEGIAGYVYPVPTPQTVPLFRYFGSGDHFYTTNSGEIGTTTPGVTGNYGYISEGIAGYVYPVPTPQMVPLFRYYGNGEHFYTTNSGEIGTTTPGVTGNYGYISEGIACYLSPVA